MRDETRDAVVTTVSVIIPTFNRAERLLQAVASVVAQSRPADEILVVDDGSSDGTAERLASAFPKVSCLRIEHAGVSVARNRGIAAATGEWLAFLDSDDEWLPEKLEAQLTALAAEPEHLAVHCDEIWIRNGRRVNPRRRHRKVGGRMFRDCLPLCAISPSAVMLHRRVLVEVGAFDESLPACEDYDLWLRLCARHPVLYVDRQLVVKHGGHEDQLSRTVPALDRYRILALTKLLRTMPLESEDRQATEETLVAKLEIYAKGALKRGRHEDVDELRELARAALAAGA